MEEFVTVAKRPKFSAFFTDKEIDHLLTLFDKFGKLVHVKTRISVCRDFKDDFLLSLALDGKADYLVTGDTDLLILEKMNKTIILTWQEFENKLDSFL